MLLDFRFDTDFLLPITLMFWLLILVSGKNIESSQAVRKRCSEKVAVLKKSALQILWTCGQNPWK